MRIATVRNASTSTTDGKLYFAPGLTGSFANQTLPTNLTGNGIRPSRIIYKNRWYCAGFFSTPVVVTEGRQSCIAGLPAPQGPPTLAVGTGAAGSEGEAIGYLTFVHKFNDRTVHMGNPSAPSQTLTLTGTGRTWTNIPTTCINPRATHVRGYLSVDGAIPKFCWERQLGVSTVTENVLTNQLGEELPTKIGEDGAPVFDANARGIPPVGPFVEVYNNAAWWTSYDFPTRVYPSKLFEPESVNTNEGDETWLETLDGEPITGLKHWGDLLIVACARSMYAIQGFSNNDYRMFKISNFYGCISNFSMVTLGPNADLVFASQEGVVMYNGAFREVMEDALRNYWKDDYRANPANYEASFAAEDRYGRGYKILIPQADTTSFYYFGCYDFLNRTGRYEWVWDRRNRQDNALGPLISGGNLYGDLYTGSCDGHIRKENVLDNGDDDGDTYGKAMTIAHKHVWYQGSQSGDDAHGGRVTDMDAYLKNQSTAVTLAIFGGDDTAYSAASPQWSIVVPAAAVTTPNTLVARTSAHQTPNTVGGKGFTVRVTATSPVRVEWRGYGLNMTKGGQEQPVSA